MKTDGSGKFGIVTIANNASARLAIREVNKTKIPGRENGPILDVSVFDERGGGKGSFHRKGAKQAVDWKSKMDATINQWRDYYGLNMSKCKMDEHATHSITPPYFTVYRDNQILLSKHSIGKDSIIFDCTAGIGCDTISFMLNFNAGKIFAIEGDKDRFEMLKYNIGLVQEQVSESERCKVEFLNINLSTFLSSPSESSDGMRFFRDCDILHINLGAVKMKRRDQEQDTPIELWGKPLDELIIELVGLSSKLKVIVLKMPRNYCKKQLRNISETSKDQLRILGDGEHPFYLQFKSYELRFSEMESQDEGSAQSSFIMNLVIIYRSYDSTERSNPEFVQVESCSSWCTAAKDAVVSRDVGIGKKRSLQAPGSDALDSGKQEAKKARTEEEEETDMQDEVVKNHYNERENFWDRDKEREALEQKNMSNFIKSVLIASAVKPGCSILDLACGKVLVILFCFGLPQIIYLGQGGDLAKWCKQKIRHYVGIDIADASVKDAVDRYSKVRNIDFPAIWYLTHFRRSRMLF